MSTPSRDELWKLYTSKNPHWLTEGVSMTPDGLKKFFEQTFELGQKHGAEGVGEYLGKFSNLFKPQYRS